MRYSTTRSGFQTLDGSMKALVVSSDHGFSIIIPKFWSLFLFSRELFGAWQCPARTFQWLTNLGKSALLWEKWWLESQWPFSKLYSAKPCKKNTELYYGMPPAQLSRQWDRTRHLYGLGLHGELLMSDILEHRTLNGQQHWWCFLPEDLFKLPRTETLLPCCPQRVVVAHALQEQFSSLFECSSILSLHQSWCSLLRLPVLNLLLETVFS